MPTTASGLVYPASSANTQLWTHFQNLADSIEPFISKPIGRLLKSAAQSINNTTETAVTFDTEIWDTHNFHSNVTNTDRVTPTVAGYYRVTVVGAWSGASTTGERRIFVSKNGVSQTPNFRNPGQLVAQDTPIMGSRLLSMNGTTDYFGMRVYQASGAALNLIGTASDTAAQPNTTLEWEYVRPL